MALARLFCTGTVPTAPANYILHMVSRVKVYVGEREQMFTIPRLVSHLSELGIAPSIDTIDDTSSLVTMLEAEIDAGAEIICGVILHLSQRGKSEERKRSVTNFIWNFISSENRPDLIMDIEASGSCPLFTGGLLPSPDSLLMEEEEWHLMFRGLVTILFREASTFGVFEKVHSEWAQVRQTGSISEYIYTEVNLWSRLSNQCSFLKLEAPTGSQRVERLLMNLNEMTKRQLAELLRSEGRRTESMPYVDLIRILTTLQQRLDIQYTWEKETQARKPSLRFSPTVTEVSIPSSENTECPFCRKKNVRHTLEQCFANPKNKRIAAATPADATRPIQPNKDHAPHKAPGTQAAKSEATKEQVTPRSEGLTRSNITPAMHTPESGGSSSGAGHRYNLRSREKQHGSKQSFPVQPEREPQSEESQDEEEEHDINSFPVSAGISPSFGFSAKTKFGMPVTVGFDSFSCLTLFKEEVCEKEKIKQGNSLKLNGIGGSTQITGQTGVVELIVQGARFQVNGYIGKTPRGIDILIGVPQIQNMSLSLNFQGSSPTAVIGAMGNLKINLHAITGEKTCQSFGIEPLDLPELEIRLKPTAQTIPYQCKFGYSVPLKLKEAAEKQISEEIEAGHMKQVEYDHRMWISPLFVKTKGRVDPETGLPKVRLLADLSLLNPNLSHPEYWSRSGPNISNFGNFITHLPDIHFAGIDISNAFHSCPVSPASRHLLVVRFGNRLLQYQTAPQGLATSALFWPLHLAAGFNKLIGEEWKSWCEVYVDDILIIGSGFVECLQRVQVILGALSKMGKAVSEKSVTVPTPEIECIGLHFSKNGIRLADCGIEKLKSVLDMLPKTSKEMRRLIGGINYASNAFDFTDNPSLFGKVMQPLHHSISSKPFRCTDKIVDSLKQLQLRIRNNPLIFSNPTGLIDENHILVICSDASDRGVGSCLFRCRSSVQAVLENHEEELKAGSLVGADYHSLSEGESRWHTFETESLALFRSVSKWGPLLIASITKEWKQPKILLLTDSQTTLSRWTKPEKVASASAKSKRFAGWALEVAFLRFLPVKLGFIDGEENCLADLFSRISVELKSSDPLDQGDILVWSVDEQFRHEDGPGTHEYSSFPFDSQLIQKISNAYRHDAESTFLRLSLKDIFETLEGTSSAHETIQARIHKLAPSRFILSKSCLSSETSQHPLLYTRASYQVCEDDHDLAERLVLVIPKTEKGEPVITTVVPLYQDGLTLRQELLVFSHEMQGHSGMARTASFLADICWWPGIVEDVKRHILSCEFCAKDRLYHKATGFQVIGYDRFSRIQMDHKILPDKVQSRTGFAAILTIVDTVSGITSFSPVKSLTAAETAHTIFTNWIKVFGIPEIIQTDNSTSFTDTRGSPNEVIAELCRLLGTKLKVITAYNPTANGRVERRHRDLGRWLTSYEDKLVDDRSFTLILAMAEISANHFSEAHVIAFGKDPRTINKALTHPPGSAEAESPEVKSEFIENLRRITAGNSEWNKVLLDRMARYNAAQLDNRRGQSRRSTANFEVGMNARYDDRDWIINDLTYGPNKETPLTALLSDPATNSVTRVKFEKLRPTPRTTGIPPPLVDSNSACDYEQGRFLFYGTAQGVYSGKILKSLLVLVAIISEPFG